MDISISSFGIWQIILLKGKFLMKAISNMTKTFENSEKNGKINIAIDLSQTTHIDSSALACIMQQYRHLSKKNGKLVLLGANEDIADIISIVGLDSTIPVFKTKADFIKSVFDNEKK
jgi:anti-anti-sigma factor